MASSSKSVADGGLAGQDRAARARAKAGDGEEDVRTVFGDGLLLVPIIKHNNSFFRLKFFTSTIHIWKVSHQSRPNLSR